MTCIHGSRSAWTKNIARFDNAELLREIRAQRTSFGTGSHVGKHHLQTWRQIYLAEARKRGLKVE
jgi:hypothetical protein